jgi:hypothetical protein
MAAVKLPENLYAHGNQPWVQIPVDPEFQLRAAVVLE